LRPERAYDLLTSIAPGRQVASKLKAAARELISKIYVGGETGNRFGKGARVAGRHKQSVFALADYFSHGSGIDGDYGKTGLHRFPVDYPVAFIIRRHHKYVRFPVDSFERVVGDAAVKTDNVCEAEMLYRAAQLGGKLRVEVEAAHKVEPYGRALDSRERRDEQVEPFAPHAIADEKQSDGSCLYALTGYIDSLPAQVAARPRHENRPARAQKLFDIAAHEIAYGNDQV
jgi:hypothetical protein